MMTQTVLQFKLGVTEERITGHAGLALFGEFMKAVDIVGLVDRHLPAPGSAVGYAPSSYVAPLIMMQHGGGGNLEDLRVVRHDDALRGLVELKKMPSSDAAGDWLRRMGSGEGLCGMSAVNREVVRRLYLTAGKVVRHAGALYLKVSSGVIALFEEIRARCLMVAQTT